MLYLANTFQDVEPPLLHINISVCLSSLCELHKPSKTLQEVTDLLLTNCTEHCLLFHRLKDGSHWALHLSYKVGGVKLLSLFPQ
jgi:hypothetical protein